jgi:hypothetical protein
MSGVGRYAPFPVKDTSAAERAVLASRVFRSILDGWVGRVVGVPRPAGGAADAAALFRPELAERLGQWSLRWQDAQDNAAKNLAGRYQAVSDHLGRMDSLENGRLVRDAAQAAGLGTDRAAELKPPPVFADITRFFRRVDERSLDQVNPDLVEVERPIYPRGVAVTLGEQIEIAGRAYATTLNDAVARFLAARRGAAKATNESTIFDAVLAERLGFWSDLWSQAEDALAAEPSLHMAAARNRSARPAWAGVRLVGPDAPPGPIHLHIERMSALENGRFLQDAIHQAGRVSDERLDMNQLRTFADVARFFRIDAERQLLEESRPNSADATASSRTVAADASRIYTATWDAAARRYVELPRADAATADVGAVCDPLLAERLGFWSIRWGRAQASAGESAHIVARFDAVRSHIERMATLEDGRALNEALGRAGRGGGGVAAVAPPRAFAEVARFFRLEAQWELARLKSR